VHPLYLVWAEMLKEKIVINKVIAPEIRELVKAIIFILLPPKSLIHSQGCKRL